MKKPINSFFTMMLLCHTAFFAADNSAQSASAAQAASVSAPSASPPSTSADQAASGSPHPVFKQISIISNVAKFSGDLSVTANKTHREANLRFASQKYAEAILGNKYVPDDEMKLLRTAHNKLEQDQIRGYILNALGNLSKSSRINLPNPIPPFLRNYVYNHTAFIHDAIDPMNINPHIAEHVKRSIGYFYEDPENPWTDKDFSKLEKDINEQLSTYRLLDNALQPGADLTNVKFIVIPDVGETDEAITSRISDLDTLFQANPHLTLVVSFADNVTTVGDNFMNSSLSTHVKKLSFTGKNLQTIGDSFFSDATALQSVDFRGLSALRSVGFCFFFEATALQSVDFRGLSALRSVEGYFFHGARTLQSVDFRGLSSLQSEGGCFFSFSTALESVDFRGLSALRSVELCFFSRATALQSAICRIQQKPLIEPFFGFAIPLTIQE